MTAHPPHYVLLRLDALQQSTTAQTPSVLAHADVEYRYADDPPLGLLPRQSDEHVLVLYHNPDAPTNPTVKSTSSQLAVSGINVLPAPGAGADEEGVPKNPDMYVLKVAAASDDHLEASQAYVQNPLAIVSRFKERNAAIRRILEYPGVETHPQPKDPHGIPSTHL